MADIKINPFRSGDPDYQMVGTDGTIHPGGDTIAEWRMRLGGDEGYVTHPLTKQRVPLSLKPYAKMDPNRTRLQIAFRNDTPHPAPAQAGAQRAAARPSRITREGKRVSEFLKK